MQAAFPKLNITVSRDTTMNSRRVIVEFGKDDLETLLRWSTSSLASVRCAVRANMVLMAATGFADRVIAQELAVGAPRVRRWVARYVKLGLPGLEKDAPRGGRPCQVSAQRVIELTTQTQPFRAGSQRESQALHLDKKRQRHSGKSHAGQGKTQNSSNSVRHYTRRTSTGVGVVW